MTHKIVPTDGIGLIFRIISNPIFSAITKVVMSLPILPTWLVPHFLIHIFLLPLPSMVWLVHFTVWPIKKFWFGLPNWSRISAQSKSLMKNSEPSFGTHSRVDVSSQVTVMPSLERPIQDTLANVNLLSSIFQMTSFSNWLDKSTNLFQIFFWNKVKPRTHGQM